MTLWTVSNQGFTVHNHICGINFLSHLRGAPQTYAKIGMPWDDQRKPFRILVDHQGEGVGGSSEFPPQPGKSGPIWGPR